MSVARLVYSQARMVGNGADDPGFFCAKILRSFDKLYLLSDR